MLRTIRITQALIDKAMPLRVGSKLDPKQFEMYARNCPVAQALNAALGEEFVVKYRNYLTCVFEAKSPQRILILAGDISQKIRLFDEDGVMQPFNFEMEVQ